MNKLIIAIAAAIALTGCASVANDMIGVSQNWCDSGDLKYCRQVAEIQVEAGTRTKEEALAEFMVSCNKAANRNKLDAKQCEVLRAKPFRK